MLQFIIGPWFLISLPYERVLLFLAQQPGPVIILAIAIVAALAAVSAFLLVMRGQFERRMAAVGLVLTAVVLIAMDLIRDMVRRASLDPYLQPENFRARPQWDVLALFLVFFSASAVLWVVMVKKYFYPSDRRGRD
jgi:hypothetical protein